MSTVQSTTSRRVPSSEHKPQPRPNNADLAAIVRLLPDVVFKCEKRADGKIYWLLNEGKLAEEFGVSTEQVRGRCLEEIFPPDVVKRILPEFERSFAGEANEFVNEMHGRFFYHFPQPVFGDDGEVTAVVGFISEVTSLKEAEAQVQSLNAALKTRVDELATANRQLQIANKQLEAFSYSVSHDLRNPLGTMSLLVQQMAAHPERLDGRTQKAVAALGRTTKRMDQLIDDVMRVAKATGGELKREDVDLSQLARRVVGDLIRREPGRDVQISIADDAHGDCDLRLTEIVLENLLGNAVKYTRKNTSTAISFGQVMINGELAFFVGDNGVGFDPREAGRLFVPFERLHDETDFEGTGVGLATVHRVIDAHGGKIWAESAPGCGATFYFTLGGQSR